MSEFGGQLHPDGDADQHGDPRLLGDQARHGVDARVGVGHARGLQHLLAVRRAEVLGLVQRGVEDCLQLGRDGGGRPLRLLEPAGATPFYDLLRTKAGLLPY